MNRSQSVDVVERHKRSGKYLYVANACRHSNYIYFYIIRSVSPIDANEQMNLPIVSPPVEYAEVQRKPSIELSSTISSPQAAQPISSSPSSVLSASSGPSSPNHTEDEKQENESNEKTDLFDEIITECK